MMEGGGECCVYLSQALLTAWRSLGEMENLTADSDIAQFLVDFYLHERQRAGRVRGGCCVCHSPLTLYCNTCQCPSPLSLLPHHTPHPSTSSSPPIHPPTTSLSTPPPPTHPRPHSLSSRSPHTSAPRRNNSVPVADQNDLNAELSRQRQCPSSVKDEFTCSRIRKGPDDDDDDGFEKCSSDVDIVKTESVVSGCNLGSDLIKPVTDIQLDSSNVIESRKKRSSCITTRTKGRTVSNQGQKKLNSVCSASASQNKAANTKFTGLSEAAAPNKLSAYNCEGIKRVIEHDASSDYNCVVNRTSDRHKSSVKECCNDGSPDDKQKARKKRRACSSHDLEDGCIISTDERGKANVHVYDHSFFEHHKLQNHPHASPGRRKKTRESKMSGTRNSGRRTLSERHSSSPVNSDGSQSDKDASKLPVHIAFTDQCSISHHQKHENKIRKCDSEIAETRNKGSSAHEVSPLKMNSSSAATATTSSDSPPLSILVSAQKILPLRTPDGNYARFLYSYFECAHCRQAFTHKRAFNSHIQIHVQQNSNSCITTRETVHSSNTNSGAKCKPRTMVQCEICGTHLKSMYALRFHIAAIHKNERPFSCEECGKSFVLKTKLRSHVKYKHAEGGPQFYCDQCNYRAFDARGLKVHQTCVHSKERPFQCSFCPSAFALKFYLDVHVRKHTGERPFRCQQCSQTFAQRSSLTRHRRKHHH